MQFAVVSPVVFPNTPIGQLTQSVTPAPPKLYLPAEHDVPLLKTDPALQADPAAATHTPEQLALDKPLLFPKEFAGHKAHLVASLLAY